MFEFIYGGIAFGVIMLLLAQVGKEGKRIENFQDLKNNLSFGGKK